MKKMFAGMFLALMTAAAVGQTGFVHASGKNLVDGHGKTVLLRGTNLGNWLVQEGYMFKLEGGPASAREIEALANDLLGPAEAEVFWHKYRRAYVTKADIDFIAKQGFNTIRVPFHYKYFVAGNDEGLELVDKVVEWAKADGLYVILDMHCAPGGQTGANIDDSWGYPWLYESEASQAEAVAVWKRIAAHYKDNPTVLGYDLINEPIPHYPQLQKLNPLLEPLLKKLTAAVRTVDTHHVVILEGAQWDSNFKVFGAPFDKNLMYQFHKYWTSPTKDVIQEYLDYRDKYNVPIWMGESGENTDEWITKFRTMLDENGVNWTFWPYKKMDATSSPVTFDKPVHWDAVVAYAAKHFGMGDTEKSVAVRPSVEDSRAAFADLLEKVQFDHVHVNQGYLAALGVPAK